MKYLKKAIKTNRWELEKLKTGCVSEFQIRYKGRNNNIEEKS